MCVCRLKELLEDVEPFFDDREVIEDLRSMIVALESMEIFKNLGLLDMKCNKLLKVYVANFFF